jgi:hypothetical protein
LIWVRAVVTRAVSMRENTAAPTIPPSRPMISTTAMISISVKAASRRRGVCISTS